MTRLAALVSALSLCSCAQTSGSMNGVAKTSAPAAAAPAPKPGPEYAIETPPPLQADADVPGEGWVKIEQEAPTPAGPIKATIFLHQATGSNIVIGAAPGKGTTPEEEADLQAARFQAANVPVSPVDRLDGSGKSAEFSVLLPSPQGPVKMRIRIIAVPGKPQTYFYVVGACSTKVTARMSAPFEAVAASIRIK